MCSSDLGKNLVVKQERVAPELDKKVEVAKAEVVRNYPKIDKPSVLSSQNIINEYIEKVNEEKSNNLYEVTIL